MPSDEVLASVDGASFARRKELEEVVHDLVARTELSVTVARLEEKHAHALAERERIVGELQRSIEELNGTVQSLQDSLSQQTRRADEAEKTGERLIEELQVLDCSTQAQLTALLADLRSTDGEIRRCAVNACSHRAHAARARATLAGVAFLRKTRGGWGRSSLCLRSLPLSILEG